jgi:lycopene cyclase domain-containing protein
MRKLASFIILLIFAALILLAYWIYGNVEGQLSYANYSFADLEWFETKWAYTYVLIATLLFPLLLSFDKKVNYVSKWKYLLYPFLIVSIPFIVWDIYFTQWGVWGFNENYISGMEISNLPIEEVSFFIIVPFACIFIYECVKAYKLSDYLSGISKWGMRILALLALIACVYSIDSYYTFSAVVVMAFVMIYLELEMNKIDRSDIYTGTFISFIPFLLMNGILTGAITQEPIVLYNMQENTGIRLGSIPIDDFFYQSGMLISMILVYTVAKDE